jgi:hypothetical protein
MSRFLRVLFQAHLVRQPALGYIPAEEGVGNSTARHSTAVINYAGNASRLAVK